MVLQNKNATTFVSKETLELLLAGAVIFILLFLFFTIFSPFFDKGKETSKSYLSSIEDSLEDADKNGKSEFVFWDSDEERNYYLIYFVIYNNH
jgi:hypothetical protein